MQIRVFACDGCGKKLDGHPTPHGWYVLEKRVDCKTQQWHMCSDACMVKVATSICDESTQLSPLCKNMIGAAVMFGELFVPNEQKENGASVKKPASDSYGVSASQP